MCRLGIAKDDLPEGLNDMRARFETLAGCVAANDFEQAQHAMHSLVGISGQMGARALHQEMRAIYISMVEAGRWPAEKDWLPKLQELFLQTERMITANYLRGAIEPSRPRLNRPPLFQLEGGQFLGHRLVLQRRVDRQAVLELGIVLALDQRHAGSACRPR